MGIPDHLTSLLRNLYADQEATVRTGRGAMDWFKIGKGVCHGCILSLRPFNLHTKCVCVCVSVTQSCLTLCDPMDSSPPGSSAHGILQARILEWVAVSFFRDLPDAGTKPASPALAGGFFTTEPHTHTHTHTHTHVCVCTYVCDISMSMCILM